VPTSKPTVHVTRHALALSFDAKSDHLTVCEFGTLPERKLPDCVLPIGEHLSFFLRRPRGTVTGFEVDGLHSIDVDSELPSLWTDPHFRVPVLGLKSAVVAAIVLRARVVLGACSTPDIVAFERADGLWATGDLTGACAALRHGLVSGNLLGHLKLAGCLAALGRYDEAYDHARVFTEVARRDSRGWACLGRICIERRDSAEATRALRRAVRLEREGSYATPAAGMLESLETGQRELPR
jgi:tetratricopeptide (TPR) repeat protein